MSFVETEASVRYEIVDGKKDTNYYTKNRSNINKH